MARTSKTQEFRLPSAGVTLKLYGTTLAGTALLYLILRHFWPQDMYLSFSQLWGSGFSAAGLQRVWFIFGWAFAVTAFTLLAKQPNITLDKPTLMGRSLWVSACAGFFEEVIYRVFVFLNAMVLLRAGDWLLGGFAGFHIVRGLYTAILVPLANWSTLHALAPQIAHYGVWVFGAAIVSASIKFRDVHKYLGFFGWVNSWFMGMIFFWLMFNYGLFTAIVAHASYDAIILVMITLTARRRSELDRLAEYLFR